MNTMMVIDSKILRLRLSEVLMCFIAGYCIGKYAAKADQLNDILKKEKNLEDLHFYYEDGEPIAYKSRQESEPVKTDEFKVKFEEGGVKVSVDSKSLLKNLFKKG